jgi:hypothetical protein
VAPTRLCGARPTDPQIAHFAYIAGVIDIAAAAHTATARNGDFDVTMPPKKAVTMVLKKAAHVDYCRRFHPNMKATLTVAPCPRLKRTDSAQHDLRGNRFSRCLLR